VVRVTRPVRLTLKQAVNRTRRSEAEIELALRTGDLRSLAPADLDAWRRAVIAATITPGRSA
jgi:hypothetical protein